MAWMGGCRGDEAGEGKEGEDVHCELVTAADGYSKLGFFKFVVFPCF
jgi:hypothetical protein